MHSLVFTSMLGMRTELNFVPMSINLHQFAEVVEITELTRMPKINILNLVVQ